MSAFLSVIPLEVHQVCSGDIEIWLKFVSGLLTVFPQFLKIVPQDLDVVLPLLIMLQPVRRDQLKI